MSSHKKPKKVVFKELDTQEGERLFKARNTLRRKGFRKFPDSKRRDGETALRRFLVKKRHSEVIKSHFESFSKRLAVCLFIGAGVGVTAMITFGLSWMAMFAVAGVVSLGCFETRTLQKQQIKKEKKELSENPKKWIKQHKKTYQLGYRSKNWLPFMGSCFNRKAYSEYGAYKIGLEEAQANKVPRIKI